MIDTRSREYVERMAAVWKANDERNRKLAAINAISILEKHDGILQDDIYELITK